MFYKSLLGDGPFLLWIGFSMNTSDYNSSLSC